MTFKGLDEFITYFPDKINLESHMCIAKEQWNAMIKKIEYLRKKNQKMSKVVHHPWSTHRGKNDLKFGLNVKDMNILNLRRIKTYPSEALNSSFSIFLLFIWHR